MRRKVSRSVERHKRALLIRRCFAPGGRGNFSCARRVGYPPCESEPGHFAHSPPANYMIGNTIDVSSSTLLTIGNSGAGPGDVQMVSFRFTTTESSFAAKLAIDVYPVSGSPVLKVGLQQDINGIPSGTWLEGPNDYAVLELERTNLTFVEVTLPSQIPLTKGTVYQLVVSADASTSQGEAQLKVFAGSSNYLPFEALNPDVNFQDNALRTLELFENGTWLIQNVYPIFVVVLSDGTSFGQPVLASSTLGCLRLNSSGRADCSSFDLQSE